MLYRCGGQNNIYERPIHVGYGQGCGVLRRHTKEAKEPQE